MDHLNHFILGFTITVLSILMPGIVNMTAVTISMKRGLLKAYRFSFGASITVTLQAFIAITFASFLIHNPGVLIFLKQTAVAIFIILSIIFLLLARHPRVTQTSTRKGKPLLLGFMVAWMNFLNIPYYFTFSTFLEAKEWIVLNDPIKYTYLAGIGGGSFIMLALYGRFAQFISVSGPHLARNLNYFLCCLFFVLAIVQAVQLYGN
ncbi:MAG: hypothetical protein R2828_03040 [Saprospiraceae bacterium]